MREAAANSRPWSRSKPLPAQRRNLCRNWPGLLAFALVFSIAAMLTTSCGKRHTLTLIQAADTGNLEEVKWLLDHGADVNGTELNDTALIFAAGRGHADVAKYLVSHGANVNAGREHGRSALLQAICNHFPELAKWLFEQGADVNVKDVNGDTALHYAARYGNSEIARLLIARGAVVDARGDGGRTSLCATLAYRADQIRDISVVEALLEGGADPNLGWAYDAGVGPGVKTPLEEAAYLKFPELEELLKKHGAK